MKIIIGSDHAGFEYKEILINLIREKNFHFKDCGCFSAESVDYPDYAHVVSKEVLKKTDHIGILICGSANGVAMAANKHNGIRAAICWNKKTSEMSITHNDANVLCLPARFISPSELKEIFDAFISSQFEGGRHKNRVDKINC